MGLCTREVISANSDEELNDNTEHGDEMNITEKQV